MLMNSISVANLSKKFGQVTALDQVTFEVKTGSITGFLGPNGAGKSTAINVMLGFLNSDGGSVKISDRLVNVKSVETRRNLGFLSNNFHQEATLFGKVAHSGGFFAGSAQRLPVGFQGGGLKLLGRKADFFVFHF